jgi:hypothetical protein
LMHVFYLVVMAMWRYLFMGEQSTRLLQASAFKKGIPSWGGEDRLH